ncbi:TBC1 domain family member 15 [Chelonia mydas]|uniref:TBC1 domain family member 15 n=1 Tax=Chelonia mydas TaxID=8469 RepID=M7BTC3_CHEMY|nr:TBC1 domain family member 15 [Chelonia mydas]
MCQQPVASESGMGPLVTACRQPVPLAGTQEQVVRSPQDKRILLVNCQNKSLSQSFENLLDEPTYGLIQKLKKDPYTATMGGFSKVTNYIFDSLRGSDSSTQQRPPSEMADFLSDAIPGLKINQQEEPGFEVITRGLCHALRKEVWKFLLGYFPWHSTREERTNLQKRKTDEYFRMKLQWKSVSDEQEKRNSRLRDYKSLIEKDVNRTDRTNKFYEGQDNPGLILLHDILMTYCMYDFDLGYVQGMSDLLSPVLYVMENEVDAFWCFVSYMDQMHENFEEQMQGMKTQLIQLSTLLRLLDSGFCNYLDLQTALDAADAAARSTATAVVMRRSSWRASSSFLKEIQNTVEDLPFDGGKFLRLCDQ